MKKIKIFHRMLLTLLIAIVGTAAVAGSWLYDTYAIQVHDRQEKTRQLVEVAHSLLSYFEAAEREGKMDREAAQQAAKSAVRQIRYDEKEYFWINDLDARIVMHPIKPEMDGKSQVEFKDPTGKRIFVEFAAVARQAGSGFVPYLWPKPGYDQPVEKLSYVKLFAPWGWVVGSGIYMDDVRMSFLRTVWTALAIGAATILAMAITIFLIARGIIRPVGGMSQAMTALASGNLQVEVPGTDRSDEVGTMARAVQVFKENALHADALRTEHEASKVRVETEKKETMSRLAAGFESAVGGVVKELMATASEMETSARGMSTTAEDTARQASAVAAASEQASANVQTVASAGEELSSSIAEIGRQVGQSTHIAGRAVEEAQATNAKVLGLAEAAQKIGDVVRLINDIAGQTNLLALNATIEAARAGEAGKGFAVVASEVKSLANQTAKATEEIAAQINAIQAATNDSVEAIQSIGRTIGQVNEIATTIAAAVEQQGAATAEISRNVQEAAKGTQEVSSNIGGVTETAAATGMTAGEMLEAAMTLAKQSMALQGVVDGFVMEVRLAGMSPLDLIRAAKSDHKAFKQKVLDAVEGRTKLAAEALADHHHCRLGRWYDKADSAIRQLPEYAALADPHQRVHVAGKRALQVLQEQGVGPARDACRELEIASTEVLRGLDALEARISALDPSRQASAA